MLTLICQIAIAVLHIIGIFTLLHGCIHGKRAVEPTGFAGVVAVILIYAVLFATYAKAGTFSLLLGGGH